jgi:sulfotransferase
MNVITGLPRSGSTLLCNILNQNPRFYASSTSMLPSLFVGIIHTWSTSIEMKSDMIRNREAMEKRCHVVLEALCKSWYSNIEKPVVFDKSRGWLQNVPPLRNVFPKAKVIVTIRDLREVFASIEKQHQLNPLLDEAKDKTLNSKFEEVFGPGGMVGGCVLGIEDIIKRQLPVFFFKLEDFCRREPQARKEMLRSLYEYLEEEYFEHDLDNIQNTATDVDALYNFKFPHQGCGKVSPLPTTWPKYLPSEMAATLEGKFKTFYQFFDYVI